MVSFDFQRLFYASGCSEMPRDARGFFNFNILTILHMEMSIFDLLFQFSTTILRLRMFRDAQGCSEMLRDALGFFNFIIFYDLAGD